MKNNVIIRIFSLAVAFMLLFGGLALYNKVAGTIAPRGDYAVLNERGAAMSVSDFLYLAGVDLNTADQKELETLPGVGPMLASRILQYRKEQGEIGSVEELDIIKGIGENTLRQISERAYINDVK